MFENMRRGWYNRAHRHQAKTSRKPRRLGIEPLEERSLLTVAPLTLADPSLIGLTGLKESSRPSLSADGQLIVFQSLADNLVPNDTNGLTDVFLYNRTAGTVTLVTVGPTGQAGGGSNPVISPDGRYVAFESNTRGILPSFTNDGQTQIFLRDLRNDITVLASVSTTGIGGNGPSTLPLFSGDSHHLGFLSNANNLVSGVTFTGTRTNLFLRTLTTGSTALVSVSQDGTSGSDNHINSNAFSLSADGRFVAFATAAENLAGQKYATVHVEDIFVRDMDAGVTTQVSVNRENVAGGDGASGLAPGQAISADGRYVVFHSTSTNLVASTVSGQNVYVRDLVNRTTTLISKNTSGGASGTSSGQSISADGRYIAFMANVKLLDEDNNGRNDVYVHNTLTNVLTLASVNAAGTNGGNGDSGFTGGPALNHGGLAFSADGRSLVFRSTATDLTGGVMTSQGNVYVRNLMTKSTMLLTPNLNITDGGNGDVRGMPAVSADGQFVAFGSLASNLVSGDLNGAADVFLRDLAAAQTVPVALPSPVLPRDRTSQLGGILGDASADGRYVVFTSLVGTMQNDLTPNVPFSGVQANSWGVFVRDTQTGAIQAVDVDATGTRRGAINTGNQDQRPIITPDGRYVVFRSQSTSLVPGVTYTANAVNIFIRNLQMQTTRIVSVDPAGTQNIPVPGDTQFAISDDGRYVAFTTNVTSAFPGIMNPNTVQHYVLLRDMGDGTSAPTTMLVSDDTSHDGVIGGDSRDLSISANGRYVLFRSRDSLVPIDGNGATSSGWDVYRWDRTSNMVELVSGNLAGTGAGDQASSEAYPPVMTPDGRRIYFGSNATNLVPANGPDNARSDIFMRDMGDGMTPGATSAVYVGNDHVFGPAISADGSTVAFLGRGFNPTLDVPEEPEPPGWPSDLNVYAVTPGGPRLVSTIGGDAGNFDSQGLAAITNEATTVPVVSPNGRYIAFTSRATDLLAGFEDGNAALTDLYVRDMVLGLTKLISYSQSGHIAGDQTHTSDHGLFTDNNQFFLFDNASTNLWPGDFNGATDPNGRDVFLTTAAGFASISGVVFDDADGAGPNSTGPGLRDWLVFLDTNNNGQPDRGEPLATSDTAGRYAFRNLVPGNYTVAIVPQPGYQQTLPAAPGTHMVSIASETQAVSGRDFGQFVPRPDLEASNVMLSSNSAAASQAVTISWTVTNEGNFDGVGSWQDAVYLSSTPMLDDDAQLLAVVPHNGGLAVDDSYVGSVTVAVPPQPGSWFVIVETDRRRQVSEGLLAGSNRQNNVAAAASQINVSIPQLTLGTPATATLSSAGPDRYYRLQGPIGKSLILTATTDAATGDLDLYVRRGSLPTPYDYDFTTVLRSQD